VINIISTIACDETIFIVRASFVESAIRSAKLYHLMLIIALSNERQQQRQPSGAFDEARSSDKQVQLLLLPQQRWRPGTGKDWSKNALE